MSKEVDLSVPLSDEDRAYLQQRSRHYDIEENDRVFKRGKFAEDYEEEYKGTNTVAQAPIEPGSDADNPPRFVGVRPYGVDQAVWGGSTGLTEAEGKELAGEASSSAQHEEDFVNTPALANPESTTAANDAQESGDGSDDDDAGSGEEDEEGRAVEDLNVEELQDELRKRDLKVSGSKAELVARLNDALEKEEQAQG